MTVAYLYLCFHLGPEHITYFSGASPLVIKLSQYLTFQVQGDGQVFGYELQLTRMAKMKIRNAICGLVARYAQFKKEIKQVILKSLIINQYLNQFKMQGSSVQANAGIRRNALIFAILTIIIHIIACFMFGFFFRLPADAGTDGDVTPIFDNFGHSVLVLIGFGLLFSYLRKMLWTGMGFTLLITALSIQMYFMMNAFWTKAVIQYTATPTTQFKDDSKLYNFFLTYLNQTTYYYASFTGAFRCALSNLVAFSAIMGRAGPLQALFVVIFGTIGYELNRQIIENYTNDAGGTSSIFVFGGFMGLSIGLLRYLRQRGDNNTIQHENYTANRSSAAFALIGTIFAWIFFPILPFDYVDPSIALHTPYTSSMSVLFSLCAATITSFLLSPLFNDGILIRDIVYGPIAGGVASATAAYWILNPAYSLVIGVVSATLQIVVMNLIQKKFAREKSIFHTYSFTLFGGQGLLGAIFAAIWNAAVRSNTYWFPMNFNTNQVFSWVISLISLPMGLLFGAAAGALCMLVASHQRRDHFDDFTYWHNDDGIRMFRDGEADIGVREKSHIIKGKKAYL